MSASAVFALLGCGVFVAALLHAAATDLKSRLIRNWLVAMLAALWAPMAWAAGVTPGQMGLALVAAALVFLAGFGCFAAGWMGGGDVKLGAAIVLWLGADQAMAFLLLSAILGGGLALSMLVIGWRGRAPAGAAIPAPRREVPYAPALALSGIALLPASPWFALL